MGQSQCQLVLVYNDSASGLIVLEAEAIGMPAYKKQLSFTIRIMWR
jgi:hypothetical protein